MMPPTPTNNVSSWLLGVPSLRRRSLPFPMSPDGDTPTARSALKAAQAGLTDGLQRLRMASLARGIGASLGDGEFSGGGAGASSGLPEGPSLRSRFSAFLWGGFGGGGSGVLWVDDYDLGSSGVRTILGSGSDGSYQIMPVLEARVGTPLVFERLSGARGGARGSTGDFGTPKELEEDDGFLFMDAGRPYAGTLGNAGSVGGAGGGNKRDGGCPGTRSVSTHVLYGPHEPGTGICGGIVARGAQGRFPDRFCLKTHCSFASHSSKSYLSKLKRGAFYVKENDSHGYCDLSLSAEAASLAPEGLLTGRNNVPGWKAVI
jgi:hypothetical protein